MHDLRRLLGAVAALVAMVTALAGCAGAGAGRAGAAGAGDGATTTSRPDLSLPASGRRSRAAEEAAVLRAWEGMVGNVITVGANPDGDSPLLAEYAAGGQLDHLRRWMKGFADRGVVLKGTIRTEPRVVALTPGERAVVRACVDGSQWVEVDARTGTVRRDPPSPPDLQVATLEPVDGTWKVTNLAVVEDRC